jgi:peptidoglycan hydrolase-like protein with peptidoglycan-binding domain
VKRSSWGARYGRGPTNITPQGVTVHYEGGGKLTGRPHSGCAARVRGIESYHVNTNGWAGIAYTLLVCEHGYVFEGRGLGRRTAANGTTSGNQNYYAVCALIGDQDTLSDTLLHGMRDAIDYLDKNGAGSRINGHRDHLATSCPGSRLYAWVKGGARRPGSKPTPPPPPSSPGTKAPAFPLPSGHWFGPESEDPRNHSGYWEDDRAHIRRMQERLRARGWSIAITGRYDARTKQVVETFQKEKGLAPDGLTGARTWPRFWTDPIT